MEVSTKSINQSRPLVYTLQGQEKPPTKRKFMQRVLLFLFVVLLCFCFSWSVLGQMTSIQDSIIFHQDQLIESYESTILSYERTFQAQKVQIESLQNFTDTLFFVNVSIVGVVIIFSLLTVLGLLDKYLYR